MVHTIIADLFRKFTSKFFPAFIYLGTVKLLKTHPTGVLYAAVKIKTSCNAMIV